MIYVADNNSVVMLYESGTYANPSGASGNWIGLITEYSPTEEENVQQIRYTGTSSRNVAMLINTAKDYEGTITYHPQDFRMFGLAFGSVYDTGSPSPYSHKFTEVNSDQIYPFTSGANSNNNFASFSLSDVKKGASDGEHQVRTYKGCCINSISLTASQGEPVTCEINWIGQSLTIGSKTTDIYPIANEDTSRPYLWSDVQVHLPSGTKMTEVTEVSWTLNNNLERRHYDNGSKVVENITPLNRDYEISLTLDANSTWGNELYTKYWQGGSSFNMLLEAVMSAGSEQGFIIMSGCKITSFESPSPSEGINEYSVTIIPSECNMDTDDLIFKHNPW